MISTILLNSIPVFAVENEEYSEAMSEELLHDYLSRALDNEITYSTGITSYDNFMTAYYDNLTYNYGINYKNSCGYIALGMLLSYYDTYLYDGIIPEQFDAVSIGTEENMIARRNSPGIVRDVIQNINNPDDDELIYMTANDYYSMLVSMSNYSLHAKLITIGAYYGNYDFNSTRAPALTNINEREQILNYFLSNISGIDSENYEITKYSSTTGNVKSFTMKAIQSGHPVLLSVAVPNSSIGHAVVAYDCNPTTGEIYCHWGLGADQTHINPEDEGFTIFRNAMIIDFNLEHSQSDNYGVTTITNNVPSTEYYCYDDCRILTYKYLHSYINHYEPYTNTQHKAYCQCGEYEIQNHSIDGSLCTVCGTHVHSYTDHYEQDSSTHHKGYCWCGECELQEHQMVGSACSLCGEPHEHLFIYTWLSNTTHQEVCFCGEEGDIKPHVVESGALTGGAMYATCLLCGGRVSRVPQIILSVNLFPHTENGSFILPNGVIVLADEDMEAYFDGSLEFICPDDNLATE